MIDIENVRKFTMSNGNVVFSSSGILSEPGGSGKTFIILALITLNRMPKAFPMVYSVNDGMNEIAITKKIVASGALINSTLIVVGNSVFKQWYYNIIERTKKPVLSIEKYHDLRVFQGILDRNVVSKYPIILMRSAPVSGQFMIHGNILPNVTRSSLEVMHELTKFRCFARVVYDDYDTIGIRDGGAMVAPGRRDHAGFGCGAGQQGVEGPARCERT
jgi:hypothetical protein